MKILIISSYLPFPLFSGGHIRLYNLISQLQKRNHEVTLVCEKRKHQSTHDVAEVKKICKQLYFFERKKQWSLKNILRTGFSTKPFLMVGHTNEEMKKTITHLLSQERFDVIHVETFYVMQNLPETTIPTILVEHNIEYLVYKRYVERMPILFRPLLYIDILKLKFWEKYFWKKAQRVVAVSKEEKEVMKRNDVYIVPNGVNTKEFEFRLPRKDNSNPTLLFIGNFKWLQNSDALEWIVEEIWPRIHKKNHLAKLWVVGKHIPSRFKKINNPAIHIDENSIMPTSKIFQQADILLAPIRVGGGTSYKILEAMSTGVPVITTPLGAEGLEVEHNKELLIASDAESFTQKTLEVLDHYEVRKQLALHARRLVEDKYDWSIITTKLEQVYASVVKGQ